MDLFTLEIHAFANKTHTKITPKNKIGRVSGYGWSFGYMGGLLCLIVAMLGFVNPEIPWFGLSKETGENIRATNILVAVWFALFSLPMILLVDGSSKKLEKRSKITKIHYFCCHFEPHAHFYL